MFYISLKWKVILISSCLMAALFSIRLMNSLEFFKNSFA